MTTTRWVWGCSWGRMCGQFRFCLFRNNIKMQVVQKIEFGMYIVIVCMVINLAIILIPIFVLSEPEEMETLQWWQWSANILIAVLVTLFSSFFSSEWIAPSQFHHMQRSDGHFRCCNAYRESASLRSVVPQTIVGLYFRIVRSKKCVLVVRTRSSLWKWRKRRLMSTSINCTISGIWRWRGRGSGDENTNYVIDYDNKFIQVRLSQFLQQSIKYVQLEGLILTSILDIAREQ